ncbi:MAG: sensor histidine kinase, partial [Myxococcota bacterium]|nr:sensor histidine kinase [Myxococcota bacterium]
MSFEAVRPRAGVEGFAETEQALGITWLRKLRWGAVFGQALAVAVAWAGFELELPYGLLLGFVAFTALGNVALSFVPLHADRGFWLPAVLFADVLVLTAFLAFSGGAANPFTVFFLVHVALSSVLLEARLTWALVLLTVLGFGSLFLLPSDPAPMMHHHHAEQPWSAHLVGMWVAYALAASFVAYFVGRVSRAIRERDRKLAAIAKLAMQNERLAALSSFSASAAHELGSPLATIGLAAKELRLGLDSDRPPAELSADAELVCREVARCRQILAGLSSRAGETVGEMPAPTTPGALVSELEQLLPPRSAERV